MTLRAVQRTLAASWLVAVCVGCSSDSAGSGEATGTTGASAGASGAGAHGTGGSGGSSGAGGSVSGEGGGAGGAGGGGAAGTLFGGVNVDLVTDDHTGFLGVFFRDPPVTAPLDLSQELGGCQLLVPRAISCNPPCAIDSVCAGVDTCTPRPRPVSVGVLHVRGLGGSELDLEPTSPMILSYQVVPTLPYPPCAEGDDVRAYASAFDLDGKCISSLTLTSALPIPVTSGQPTHLTWMPPGRSGISRVQIALEISHHGGFKGEIDCDVADTGSLDIPEPLVTGLVRLGRAGYPTIKVARTSISLAPTQPQVKLVLSSQVEVEVDTGVISCGAANSPPCPAGTMCQIDYTCR